MPAGADVTDHHRVPAPPAQGFLRQACLCGSFSLPAKRRSRIFRLGGAQHGLRDRVEKWLTDQEFTVSTVSVTIKPSTQNSTAVSRSPNKLDLFPRRPMHPAMAGQAHRPARSQRKSLPIQTVTSVPTRQQEDLVPDRQMRMSRPGPPVKRPLLAVRAHPHVVEPLIPSRHVGFQAYNAAGPVRIHVGPCDDRNIRHLLGNLP
jgi:hypothetical protein